MKTGDLVRLHDLPNEVFMISGKENETYELINHAGDTVLGSFNEGDMTAVSLWNDDYHINCKAGALELISALVKFLATEQKSDLGWVIWI